MPDLRTWLSEHHPDLLAEYDRQIDEGSTRLGLECWLMFYHDNTWRAWQAGRIEVVRPRWVRIEGNRFDEIDG